MIETDASGYGIGAVLMQNGHPLAFFSKTLGPKSRGLSAYEKEYTAILMALDQWRSYLQYAEFQIVTDHRSLVQLIEQRLHTPWQQKVFTKLMGLQYHIVYHKGLDNGAADVLSRAPPSQLQVVSMCQPQWVQDVIQSYEGNAHAQDLLTKLSLDSAAVPHFSLRDGLLRYKSRIWVGSNAQLQLKLISAVHDTALGGHFGILVTYSRLKNLFAWQGMKAAVQQYVNACSICQQAKPDRTKLPGLLPPLSVPDRAWSVISMDFIEGLPLSSGSNCILVVVDLFSKYSHFLPLSIRSQLKELLRYSSHKSTNSMVSPQLLSQTGIKSLLATFGGSSSRWLELNCA